MSVGMDWTLKVVFRDKKGQGPCPPPLIALHLSPENTFMGSYTDGLQRICVTGTFSDYEGNTSIKR